MSLNSLDDRLSEYRARSLRSGHKPDPVGEAWVLAWIDESDIHNVTELASIERAIEKSGSWSDYQEWRISTHFKRSIEPTQRFGKAVFRVEVECDGQTFCSHCPSLEKAYGIMRAYERLIVAQFYSIGPSWA